MMGWAGGSEEVIVTSGIIDVEATSNDPNHLTHLTARGIGGMSGGPVVNAQGQLVGIPSAAIPKDEIPSETDVSITTEIIGTKFYSIKVIGDAITRAIEGHRESLEEE